MSPKPLRLLDYLDLILESISRIEEYTAGLDKEVFLEIRLVQDAVIRNFEIIGGVTGFSHGRGRFFQPLADPLCGDAEK
jgi:hypothetical protein